MPHPRPSPFTCSLTLFAVHLDFYLATPLINAINHLMQYEIYAWSYG